MRLLLLLCLVATSAFADDEEVLNVFNLEQGETVLVLSQRKFIKPTNLEEFIPVPSYLSPVFAINNQFEKDCYIGVDLKGILGDEISVVYKTTGKLVDDVLRYPIKPLPAGKLSISSEKYKHEQINLEHADELEFMTFVKELEIQENKSSEYKLGWVKIVFIKGKLEDLKKCFKTHQYSNFTFEAGVRINK